MLALECWHGDGDGDGCMDHGSMELDEPSWYTAQRRQAKRAIEATVWLRFATGSQSSCTILPWCNSYTHTSSEHISIPLVIGPLTYSCSNNFVRREKKERETDLREMRAANCENLFAKQTPSTSDARCYRRFACLHWARCRADFDACASRLDGGSITAGQRSRLPARCKAW